MPPTDSRTRSRLALSAAIGGTAVLATALIVTTTSLATDTATVALEPAAAVTGTAQLDDVDLPDPPTTCSAAQLADRDRQVQLLTDEQTNEQRVLATVTDGSLSDKLGAIRDRAELIIGRIDRIDAQCPVERPGAPTPVPATAEAPPAVVASPADPADRTLAALAISCAEPDLTGIDPAAADRARTELAGNEAELDGRLATELPRFSARVANEADPDTARTEFGALAANLADTLAARRTAILARAGVADAATAADTCQVVPAAT